MLTAGTISASGRVLLDLLDAIERAGRRDGAHLPPEWQAVRQALSTAMDRHSPTTVDVDDEAGDGERMEPLLLDFEDVARRLGCSRRTVERLAATGSLPVVRLGSMPRVRSSDLAEYIATLPKEQPA